MDSIGSRQLAPSKRSEFKNLSDIELLTKSFFLVSTGNVNHYDVNLQAIISLLNKYYLKNPKIERLDILIAGTLQRHNFWMFSPDFSDNELINLLKDISADLNLEDFAVVLAEKFYSAAKQLEKQYIEKNKEYYLKLRGITPRFIVWHHGNSEKYILRENPEKPEPIYHANGSLVEQYELVTPDVNLISQELYSTSSIKIKDAYKNNDKFHKAIERTLTTFLKHKINLIETQSQRIATLIPHLNKFFKEPEVLARICGRNYLLEECPLFIPVFSAQGYKSMLYPAEITPALRETQKLFESEIEYVDIELRDREDEYGFSDDRQQVKISFYNYSEDAPNDEEKKLISDRFDRIVSNFNIADALIFKNAIHTYTGNSYNRSTVCAMVFLCDALRSEENKDYLDVYQCLRYAALVSEYFKGVETLSAMNLKERDGAPVDCESILVDLLTAFEVDNQFRQIEYHFTISERADYKKLLEKLEISGHIQFPEIFIAKGDEYKTLKRYKEAKQCYQNALYLSRNENLYRQFAKNKIEELEEAAANTRTSPPEEKSDNSFIMDAIVAIDKKHQAVNDFSRIKDCVSPLTEYVCNNVNREIGLLISSKYRSPNDSTSDDLSYTHAQCFIMEADFLIKHNFHIEYALRYYKNAIFILDLFGQTWKRIDWGDYDKAEILTKIAEAERLISRAQQPAILAIPTDRIANTPIDSIISRFLEKFKYLDQYHVCEYSDSYHAKVGMLSLTNESIREINNRLKNCSVSYTVFISLFDCVNQSKLLDKHYAPRRDYWWGIKITDTKKVIIGAIRKVAMFSLRQQLNSHELSQRERLQIVSEAKALPMFSLSITNEWNYVFFKPKKTECLGEMDQICERYANAPLPRPS